MVNVGGATDDDVRRLVDLAQTTVERELGYELKTEIGMIGEF
jgi:UDP-N-acetylenolpyruvoylglucosamine reductase